MNQKTSRNEYRLKHHGKNYGVKSYGHKRSGHKEITVTLFRP